MFELLFWGMEREADLRLSLACIRRICRASFVSAGGWREPSTSGALPPSPPRREDGDHRFCAQSRHIFVQQSLKACVGFSSKLARLLGPVL